MALTSIPGRFEKLPSISPQQQVLQSSILNQIPGLLSGLTNNQSSFDPIRRQATRQFEQQTIPTIAERFTSMGNNALSSPAFVSQLGQAGSGLSENLAALQSQYGLEQGRQQQNLLNLLLGYGMQPSFQYAYQPGQTGFLESILGGAAQGLGAGLGGLGMFGGASLLSRLLGDGGNSMMQTQSPIPMIGAMQQTMFPRQQSGLGQLFGGF